MSREKDGFTLVELLVVISIIALLLAMLIPSLQTAREQSKLIVCNSNVKQWGLVFATYTNEYNGGVFHGWSGPKTQVGDQWPSALRKYYKDAKLRLCPSATKIASETRVPPWTWPNAADQAWGVFSATDIMGAGDYGSYGVNGWVYNKRPGSSGVYEYLEQLWGEIFWKNVNNVKNASNVPFMLDAFWVDGFPQPGDTPPDTILEALRQGTSIQVYGGMQRFLPVRHIRRKSSVAMLDGSVKSARPKDLWYFTWHRKYELKYPPVWPASGWMN